MTKSLSYFRLPEIMKVAPEGHDKKKKLTKTINAMLSKVQPNALFPPLHTQLHPLIPTKKVLLLTFTFDFALLKKSLIPFGDC